MSDTKRDLTDIEDEKRRRARAIRRAGREPGTRWTNAYRAAYLSGANGSYTTFDAFAQDRATPLFLSGLTATEAAQVAARETPSAADLRSQVIWTMAGMGYADLMVLAATARHTAAMNAQQAKLTADREAERRAFIELAEARC